MKNNLTITTLFLFFSCFVFAQENTIHNLEVDSRENGTLIKIGGTRKINLKDVTAWYSSEWFYLTVYNAQTDSTKLADKDFDGSITKIEIANNEESTQIALKLRKEIESFEITNPTRRNISFLLRLSQEEAKKSIEMDEDIQKISEQNIEYDQSENKEDLTQEKNFTTNKLGTLLPLIGVIVSAIDISNPTIFLIGAIVGLSSIFF
mgnify:FL=1|tara:strand:- start:94 stop:711 length:618 start_codon:yes stop_codon:yes gene_type:complete